MFKENNKKWPWIVEFFSFELYQLFYIFQTSLVIFKTNWYFFWEEIGICFLCLQYYPHYTKYEEKHAGIWRQKSLVFLVFFRRYRKIPMTWNGLHVAFPSFHQIKSLGKNLCYHNTSFFVDRESFERIEKIIHQKNNWVTKKTWFVTVRARL